MPAPTIPDPTTPTSQEIWDASKLRWTKLRIQDATALEDYRIGAAAYIVQTTGRYWSDWPPPATFPGAVLTDTPEMIPLANAAMRLRVEQIVLQAQPDYTDTAADDLIQSMSVGAYSETRRDTATLRGGRSAAKPLLNTHPGLNALLEALMTDERFEFWLYRLQGMFPPAFQVEEVDWGLVGSSMLRGSGFDPFAPWPMWTGDVPI